MVPDDDVNLKDLSSIKKKKSEDKKIYEKVTKEIYLESTREPSLVKSVGETFERSE